ncbi:MAG: hypothetical protein ACLRU1_06820 [Veillonella parvula]
MGELLGINNSLLEPFKNVVKNFYYGNIKIKNENGKLVINNDKITEAGKQYFKFDSVKEELEDSLNLLVK